MRRVFVLACVIGVAACLASVAAACHSELSSGTLNCAGLVSYTATAWNGSDATDAGRTNTDVRVFVSTDSGRSWQRIGSGQFLKSNGFSFSGSYQAGTASSVMLKVQEYANWGNGDAPAEARYLTVNRPSNCTSTPPPPPPGPGTTPPPPPPGPGTTPGTGSNNTVVVTPPAAVPAPSVSLVKLERVGSAGDFVAGPSAGSVGDTVYYQMIVTNKGTSTIGVNLKDDGCDAGTLAPAGPQAVLGGASLTFTCSHRLAAADGAQYINTALVTANNAGPQEATATASVTTNINAVAGVAGATKTIVKKQGKHAKVKKVVKRAKAARAVIRPADFTG
jgi:hypothetical protein